MREEAREEGGLKMATQQRQRKCRTCGRKTLHARETFGFGWGCLLTILTGGLFLVVWVLIDLFGMIRPWRCQVCGGAKVL